MSNSSDGIALPGSHCHDLAKNAQTLQETIPPLMRKVGIPGLAIAVVRDGIVVWNRGFGLREAGSSSRVDVDTVFEGASFSKPLFAYGVLQLVHEGLLDLDTSLTEYLGDRSFCDDPRLDGITARMVLSHTTGFPNWRLHGEPLTLDRSPGERFGYSGEGYVYLQQVVEHIVGRPLHEYMQHRVLFPLQMTQSSYVWRESYTDEAAPGLRRDGTAYPKEQPATANAAASLHTTPRDFAVFLNHIIRGWNRPSRSNGVDIVAMLTPQVHVAGNLWWGLGWGLRREPDDMVIWHWGDNPGFTNFAAARLSGSEGVVVMTNSDNGLRAWNDIVCKVLGADSEIFDWLANTFYGARNFGEVQPWRE